MGAINFSINEKLLTFFKYELDLNWFIETGTFEGSSLEIASRHFQRCISVELSDTYYNKVLAKFKNAKNVELHNLPSPELLRRISAEINHNPCLFWLDAHWCMAEGAAGEDSQTPLLEELESIKKIHADSVVLIDDARLYLCPPCHPHSYKDWPGLSAILARITTLSNAHAISVYNDVIIVYPKRIERKFNKFAYENGVDWLHIALTSKNSATGRRISLSQENGSAIEMRRTHDLPISVILPTRNSMERLPAHLEDHIDLLFKCSEVIHCDSESQDGTVNYTKKVLHQHTRFKQINHEPGLYESWNRAIQECGEKYIYISTIGDRIDLKGLNKLLQLAEVTKADIVISPPRMVNENGSEEPSILWPIHKLIQRDGIDQPGLVNSSIMFKDAIMYAPEGVCGSAASCLFRTSFLKVRPFPLGFNGACDTAWGIQNIPDARCAILPDKLATFLIHTKSYESNEVVNRRIGTAMRRFSLRELRRRLTIAAERSETLHLPPELAADLKNYLICCWALDKYNTKLKLARKRFRCTWIFNRYIWRMRNKRNHFRDRVRILDCRINAKICDTSFTSG